MSTITVKLGEEAVDLTLDAQLFIGLGLVSANLITMPQWWQRTSGRKIADEELYKVWLWREAVFAALSHVSAKDLREVTKARAP